MLPANLPAKTVPLPVFVSIGPQKWIVEQLGGDFVSTQVLLDKGQEPHTYQPSPEKMTALFRSRLYFTVGMPFEQEIARKINSHKNKDTVLRLIDVTTGIKKIPMVASHVAHHHKEDHKKHDRHGKEKAEQTQEHADPHLWLDPRNVEKLASAMTEALATADPKHAAAYQQNLQALKERLTLLHQELGQQLAPFQGATFFVFHPAFGYFAHAYGLHQEAVEIEGKAPSPKQLYALVKKAKADKVKVLFVQPQFDRRNAQTLALAITGKLAGLDPLAEDIEQNLRQMAKAIQTELVPR
ncbi:zinc ABC transporter substrate-binding protein [Desulfobulbus sp. US1]|uniref:Zinc transport system substrate-binding protein n=1 Tax=Candidatus Electrothrix communis TaxID=1859133 RepID=A0A3S3QWB8_9BACT|nr:zinc ABC transporter substrate-binding protein [Desulfobulbus sp. US4]MCW5204912.1 zinc ABC transporter substrate-binding protein [Desulfobulbus sp. N2]MCW5209359.1 zinc ABC transporter substrate-binding protein [Desulfobulbus sp. US1]MCW5210252.1 zinc ABC transporter substrate-binding protein [Desulfobulbus sp. N3]RWX44140.1 zinc transport system substrate-binding protein [Candidatus Electrothrix communis]